MNNILDDFKYAVVTVTFPNLGSTATLEHLNKLTCAPCEVEEVKHKTDLYPSIRKFTFTFRNSDQDKPFIEKLKRIFNSTYLYHSVDYLRRFASEKQLLAHLMETHDWTYEMSDDHRSWSSGNANERLIKRLGLEVFQTDDLTQLKELIKY